MSRTPSTAITTDAPSAAAGWPVLAVASVLILAALGAYWNSFNVPLLFDDTNAIGENPSICHLGRIGDVLSPPPTVLTSGRPLLNLTFALNYAGGGMSVRGYHVVNLLIHICAGLVLLGIVRRTLLLPSLRHRYGEASLPLAAFATLIWTLHPLQTEAVTYISQRAESLMGLFYLLTLYGFIRSVTAKSRNCWLILSVAACLCGMATKQVMVTAPVLVLLYDRAFVSGSFRAALASRRWYYVSLASTWLLLGFLMHRSSLAAAGVGFHEEGSWVTYALTELRVVTDYLKLAFWPHPLVFDYGTEILATHPLAVAPYALIIAAALVGVALTWRKSPTAGFIGAWFFLILAPTSTVVPIAPQPMAESRMYLPLAAVILLVTLLSYAFGGRRSFVFLGLLGVGLGALSGVAFVDGATVKWNGSPRATTFVSSDTLTAAIPASDITNPGSLGIALITVRNPSGDVSQGVGLPVKPPVPVILTQPQSQSVLSGASVTFSVTASGTGMTYQWRQNDVEIPNASASSYTIASASPAVSGSYTVVVSNETGSVTSSEATLTIDGVSGPPRIECNPESTSVYVGSSATFSVTATGAALTYQWQHDGEDVPGATASSYTITSATMDDAGSYDVVVSNEAGSVSSASAALSVTAPPAAPPIITRQPNDATVNAGGTASFTVVASGDGPLYYSWSFTWSGTGSSCGQTSGWDQPTLTISGAQTGDEGVYQCTMYNSDFSAVVSSVPVRLNVRSAPLLADSVTWAAMTVNATSGQNVILTTTATNDGTSTWTSNFQYAVVPSWTGVESGTYSLAPSGSVAPGATSSPSFTITAPSTTGTYTLTLKPKNDSDGWFDHVGTIILVVNATAFDQVTLAGATVTGYAGQSVSVVTTATNTGTTTWDNTFGCRVSPNWTGGGNVDYPLVTSGTVTPGSSNTLSFRVTAPATPGTYSIALKPYKNSHSWLNNPSTITLVVQASPPDFVAWSYNTVTGYAGQKVPVTTTATNTGTTTWNSSYQYDVVPSWSDGTVSGTYALAPTGSVAPKGNAALSLAVTAPSAPGTYTLTLKPKNGDGAINNPGTITLVVQPCPPDFAAWPDITATGYAGQSVSVTTTATNVGTTTWDSTYYYSVTGSWAGGGNLGAYPLAASGNVAPGGTNALSFRVTAPTSPGTYTLTLTPYYYVNSKVVFNNPGTVTLVVQASPPDFVAWSYNTVTGYVGQKVIVTTTATNMGTSTWDSNYQYDVIPSWTNGTASGTYPLALAGSVAPNKTAALSFTVTAPNSTGTYTLTLRPKKGATALNNPGSVTLVVQPSPPDFAAWADTTVTGYAGQSVTVTTTATNTGTSTWTTGYWYQVRPNWTGGGLFDYPLVTSGTLAPGGASAVSFRVTAPTNPGTYTLSVTPLNNTGAFNNAGTVTLVVQASPPDFVAWSYNTVTGYVGQKVIVTTTATNTGTTTWDSSYQYDVIPSWTNGTVSGTYPLARAGSVASKSNSALSFTVPAPNTPGTYTLTLNPRRGGTALNNPGTVTLTVQPCPPDFVAWTDNTVTGYAGQSVAVTTTATNTGTSTWSNAYHCGVRGSWSGAGNLGSYPLVASGTVAPGGTSALSFRVTAPATPGTYTLALTPSDATNTAINNPSTITLVVQASPPDFVAWPYNTVTGYAGQKVIVTTTATNTGTSTWDSSYQYDVIPSWTNSTVSGTYALAPTGSVAPKGNAALSLAVTAPSAPGTYTLTLKPKNGDGAINNPGTITLVVQPCPPDFAAWPDITATGYAGQSVSVTTTATNVGTSTWTADYRYVVNPAWSGGGNTTYSLVASGTVPPGGTSALSFRITAPATAGTYTLALTPYNATNTAINNPSTITLVVQASPPDFVAWSYNTVIGYAGQKVLVTTTATNTGTTTWDSSYQYDVIPSWTNGTASGTYTLAPAGSVAPKGKAALLFAVTAPSTPGTYILALNPKKGNAAINDPGTVTLTVQPCPPDFVAWADTTITGYAGQSVAVTATATNTGTSTWSNAYHCSVRGSWSGAGNLGSYPLVASGTVAPGGTSTLSFRVTAPATPGTYTLTLTPSDATNIAINNPGTINLVVQASPPDFVAWSYNTVTGYAGQKVIVTTTATNTGTTTWDSSYQYDVIPSWAIGTTGGTYPLAPAGSVAPKANAALSFMVTAPSVPGTYMFTLNPRRGDTAFNNPGTVTLTVQPSPPDFVAWADTTITGYAGQSVTVTTAATNVGTNTWTTDYRYVVNPAWSGGRNASNPLVASGTVASGETSALSFRITAPTAPGTYTMALTPYNASNTAINNPSTITLVVQASPPDFVAWSYDTVTGYAGQKVIVTTTATNTGTTTWDSSYQYDVVPSWTTGTVSGTYTLAPAGSVAPKANAALSFAVTAPAAPGTYTLTLIPKNSGGALNNPGMVTLTVQPCPPDFVAWADTTVTGYAGQSATVTTTATNVGTSTWTTGYRYVVNPAWSGVNNTTYPLVASGTVAPGETSALSFRITAPTTPGTYTMALTPYNASNTAINNPSTITLVVQASPPDFVAWSYNTVIGYAGQKVFVTTTATNTGTTTWDSSYQYDAIPSWTNGTASGTYALAPAGSVAPKGNAALSFAVTAPATPGTYTLTLIPKNSGGAINDPGTVTLTVQPCPPDFVAWADNTVSGYAGQSVTVTTTATNVGTSTWTDKYKYLVNPGWAGGSNATYPLVASGGTVVPGGTSALSFRITAPATPGTYTMALTPYNASNTPINNPSTITLVVLPCPPDYVAWGDTTVNWFVGQKVTIATTATNTGTTTWNSNYQYEVYPSWLNGAASGIYPLAPAGSVAPKGVAALSFRLTAPGTPGTYTLTLKPKNATGDAILSVGTVTLVVQPLPPDFVVWDDTTVTGYAGQSVTVTTVATNIGTTTWDSTYRYSVDPSWTGTNYRNNYLAPTGNAAPGTAVPGTTTWPSFTITAPTTPGTYTMALNPSITGGASINAQGTVTLIVQAAPSGNDPAADYDKDGVSNAKEAKLGTNPLVADALVSKTADGFTNIAKDNLNAPDNNLIKTTSTLGNTLPSEWTTVTLADSSKSTVVGSTAGELSVDHSGAAVYSIPIWASPGTAGMEPKISLTYSSQGGAGVAGYGWSIGGLTAIARGSKTMLIDGKTQGLTFTNADGFYLDGQRLVYVEGGTGNGTDGATYRTELDSLTRVVSYGSAGNGPAWFRAWTKAGLIIDYGNSVDSRLCPQRAEALSWSVQRMWDTTGNYLEFVYSNTSSTGEQLLTGIKYTGHSNGRQPYASLNFSYENRNDSFIGYRAGAKLSNTKRLHAITAMVGNSTVRTYTLGYLVRAITQRSLLQSVTEAGTDGRFYPPLTFDYREQKAGWSDIGFLLPCYIGDDAMNLGTAFVDLNGDGRPDVVQRRMDQIGHENYSTAWLNTPTGWIPADGTNGQPNFKLFGAYALAWESRADTGTRFIDFDGDGRVDVISSYINHDGSIGSYASRNTGDGWADASEWAIPADTYLAGHKIIDAGRRFVDVNGDGLVDLIWCTSVLSWVDRGCYLNNSRGQIQPGGPKWVRDDRWAPNIMITWGSQFIDVNGDGLVDQVLFAYGGGFTKYGIAFNSPTGWQDVHSETIDNHVPSPTELAAKFNGLGRFIPPMLFNTSTPETKIAGVGCEFVDLNGDGLVDQIFSNGYISYGGPTAYLNTGNGWVAASSYVPPIALSGSPAYDDHAPTGAALIDLNGDGLVDLIQASGSQGKHYWLNTGRGWSAMDVQVGTGSLQIPEYFNLARSDNPYLATGADMIDWDGDGMMDAVWRHSNGVSFGAKRNTALHDDRLIKVTNGLGVFAQIEYKPLTDPTVYNPDNGQAVDNGKTLALASRYVVSYLRNDDGQGSTHDIRYQYGRWRTHYLYGDLGFGWMQQYDEREVAPGQTSHTVTNFVQDYPFVGMPAASATYLQTGNSSQVLGMTVNTYAEKALTNNPKVHFVYSSSSTQIGYELDGKLTSTVDTTINDADIDAYGNVKKIAVTDSLGDYTKTTQSSFDNYVDLPNQTNPGVAGASRWFLGRLSTSTVSDSGPSAPLSDSDLADFAPPARTSSFTYYETTHGLLKSETVEPNDNTTLKVTTSYEYDASGNKTKATVSGAGLTDSSGAPADRVTQTQYDSNGRFPLWTKNALLHTENYSYDASLGTLTWLQGPNNLYTKSLYDGFGRRTREIRNLTSSSPSSGSEQTDVTYRWASAGAPVGSLYLILTQPSGAPPSAVFYNRLGQACYSAGINGGALGALDSPLVVYARTLYDSRGRAYSTSRPYFTGESILEASTTNSFDAAGRPLLVTVADDASAQGYTTTSFGYSATADYNTVTTATRTRTGSQGSFTLVASTTKNTQGWVVESIGNQTAQADAPQGRVTHLYDAIGNLRRTRVWADAAQSTKTTFYYDQRGRKSAMRDPDMGYWSYSYDAAGGLISQTSARNKTTTMRYDQLGRLVYRAEPEGNTFWTYDTATMGKGKLAQVDAPGGYKEVYAYDTLGRPQTVTRTILGVAFSVTQQYDTNGRPTKTIYPYGYAVTNLYNGLGFLREVHDARTASSTLLNDTPAGMLYWQADSYSRWGTINGSQFGNGVSYDRLVSDVTGRVTGIVGYCLCGPGNTYAQNTGYTYDNFGNVTHRVDSTTGRDESFTYDGLNRLRDHQINGVSVGLMSYDALGNIISKPGGGTYSYGGNLDDKPHANRGDGSYIYDGDGNLTNGRDGQAYEWTSYDQLKKITKDGVWTEFSFGAGRERITQKKSDGTTEIYVGALFEQVVNSTNPTQVLETRFYVMTPAGRTAVRVEKPSAKIETRWFHQDALGSVVAVTNEWGQVERRYGFDAWGKATAGAVLTSGELKGTATLANPPTRGFTDHEMLADFGLIHMNGRVYDPVLGRVLSADPFVDGITDSQAFNRYSYCGNNPINGNDPSGYFNLKDAGKILAVAVVTYFSAGWGASAMGGWLSSALPVSTAVGNGIGGGLAGGFASGFSGSLLNGANINDACRAGVVGCLSGAALGGMAGAVGDYYGHGVGSFGNELSRAVAHGIANGAVAQLSGGQFRHGFYAGIAGSAASSVTMSGPLDRDGAGYKAARTTIAAVAGGTGSVLGGGKFVNGAVTAAFQHLFNAEGARHKVKVTVAISKQAYDQMAQGPDYKGMTVGDVFKEELEALNSDTLSVSVVSVVNKEQIDQLAKAGGYLYVIAHGEEGIIKIGVSLINRKSYFDSTDRAWAMKRGYDMKEFDSDENFRNMQTTVLRQYDCHLSTFHCDGTNTRGGAIIDAIKAAHAP
jgi:RHS repeat-associated protein